MGKHLVYLENNIELLWIFVQKIKTREKNQYDTGLEYGENESKEDT